jgi:hypothetical protein
VEITRTESTFELAASLLREEFSREDPVSRHNTVLARGGQGHEALGERRRWAEAWQLVEAGRLICRDPEESRGSNWFLTGAGRQALTGGDVEGALLVAGVQP